MNSLWKVLQNQPKSLLKKCMIIQMITEPPGRDKRLRGKQLQHFWKNKDSSYMMNTGQKFLLYREIKK